MHMFVIDAIVHEISCEFVWLKTRQYENSSLSCPLRKKKSSTFTTITIRIYSVGIVLLLCTIPYGIYAFYKQYKGV